MSDNFFDSYFADGSIFSRELFRLTTGDWIGSGIARQVFEFALDKTRVIKYESGIGCYHNTMEWTVWQYVWDKPKLRKWFAPCYWISDFGGVLIQAKVEPLTKKRAPEKMPAFFCDFKYQNYGIYKGRVVCCDYGLPTQLFEHGFASGKMHKARWWNA